MANLREYLQLWLDFYLQIFHRFFWSASDIKDREKKAVFITGCDTGFGHSAALNLNENGFHVYAGCLFPEKDEARGLLIKAKNPLKMTVVQLDVTNDLSVRLAYEKVSQQLRSQKEELHAVVNNAGIAPLFELEWGSMSLIRRVLEVNTLGPILVSKTFLPLIRETKGRIVNVNSIAARYAVPGLVHYSISKTASLAFTEGLRREVAKFGVKAISIEPWFYGTPMANVEVAKSQMETVWREADPAVKDAYGDHYFKRAMKSNETVAQLASDDYSLVVERIRHAVMNTYPQHHYIVAPTFIKFILTLGMYQSPQEFCELMWNSIVLWSGLGKALPGSYGDKKKS